MIYVLHSFGEFAQNIVKLIALVILSPINVLFGKLLDIAKSHGIINETVSEVILMLIFFAVLALFLYGGYLLFKYSIFLLIASYFSSILFGLMMFTLGVFVIYYLFVSRGYKLKKLRFKFIKYKQRILN